MERSSKEPFLKAATLSILIWAYPRETKTNDGNFKKCRHFAVRLLMRDEHAHSFLGVVSFVFIVVVISFSS